ncbi:fatty acid desaturase [Paraburkholderia rhizosphaerae]|uniref:fatty acid desaturase n=1 Tax=Paraburkholderia rhizosphaerae TaxID=480658 RepID=UPI001FB9A0A1|nr:fatty acid desaturase [Paraburkholderia rhizosphaerae]
MLLAGVCGSVLVLSCSLHIGWLVVTITSTVSGARYIVATIIHHGVHHAVFRSRRANQIMCEILSTVLIVQPFDSYRKFHVHEHHGRAFSTMDDQDLAAIYTLGLTPGTPVATLKLRLAWQCISPLFHVRFLWGRVKCNLLSAPAYRVAMTVVWFAALIALANALSWPVFAVSIALPLTTLYQICSLLHLITEHAWVLRVAGQSVRDSHIDNSHARFCGRMLPSPQLTAAASLYAWTTWTLEHLLIHLPARLLIVQGSLIAHDWHHRSGADRRWPNAIQQREADVQKELANGACTYRDIWGVHHALHEVLQRISDAPAPEATERLRYRLN